MVCRTVSCLKGLFPLRLGFMPLLVLPKRRKNVAIGQQYTDGRRELLPDQLVKLFVTVELYQLVDKSAGFFLFPAMAEFGELLSVGSVKGYPKEDKAPVVVIALLCAVEPA